MTDRQVVRYRVTVPRNLMRRIEQDRAVGHRLLMALLVPTALDKSSPREAAKLLWAIVSPDELLVSSGVRLESTTDVAVEEVPFSPVFEQEKDFRVEGMVEVSHTPTSRVPDEIWNLPNRPAIRNKRVPVPDEQVQDWLTKKMERSGLTIKSWKGVATKKFKARNLNLSGAQFSAVVNVIDADKANSALFQGFGRSKNFGCGLLQLEKIT